MAIQELGERCGLGGTPRVLVPDNMKTAVTATNRGDVAKINATFQELADHYQVCVLPTRPGKPKDKSDVEVTVPIIDVVQAAFPEFNTCSFDRGFHSLKNREALDTRLAVNALPKKGKLSLAERAPAFKAARQQHPAVESCLANFGLRGGALVQEKNPENFALMVGLSVLAVNVHRLGCLVRDQERARIRRRRKRAA